MRKLWARSAGTAVLVISLGCWPVACTSTRPVKDEEASSAEKVPSLRMAPPPKATPKPVGEPKAAPDDFDRAYSVAGESAVPHRAKERRPGTLKAKPPPPPAQPMSIPAEEPEEVMGGVEGGVAGGVVGGERGGPLGAAPPGKAAAPSASPRPLGQRVYVNDGVARDEERRPVGPGGDGNRFARLEPNPFTSVEEDRFSTFAVDVDTASYAVARRYINQGQLPPPDAIRVEEFVNYFKYKYPAPEKGAFAVHMEGAPSPYTSGHHLLKVGLQGRIVSKSQRKPTHLVFLVDVSGSMVDEDRLPLAREAMKLAIKNLNENDTVAIVTYAGAVRDVLPPTPATDRARLFAAIDSLKPGGGTAMGSGLELAYKHAVQKASGNAISRVVVLTDGDTNLGPNLTADAMLESVRKYVAEGVTLSTIGFGMGNYRDDLMERIANKGNGNCFYIDSFKEARKVFEQQLAGTLEVIAKDVKVQVEFNPATVRTYRLIGYENRDIADRDFRNDKVDAGEIGAGHSVTALYEVQLTGRPGDLGTVRVRAKEPSGTEAKELAFAFSRSQLVSSLSAASDDLRFAAAVAGTADVLRRSEASEAWSLATAEKLAQGATGGHAERQEFVVVLAKARRLWEAIHRVAGR